MLWLYFVCVVFLSQKIKDPCNSSIVFFYPFLSSGNDNLGVDYSKPLEIEDDLNFLAEDNLDLENGRQPQSLANGRQP